MHGPGRIAFFLLLWWAVSLVACVRGDRYVADSHAAYNETLRARLDEELLLNLVRLRYRDRPLFLQVNSVIARFERSFGVSLSGYAGGDSASTSAERPTGYARGSIGGDVEFSETPTVTFTPLQGEDFAERLLRPIEIETLTLLQRSGWSIERVLRTTVQRMNGLDNASAASGPTPTQAPTFRQFVAATKALRQLQDRRAVVFGTESSDTVLGVPLGAERLLAADVLAAAVAGHRFEADREGAVVLRSTSNRLVLRVAASQHDTAATQQLRERLGLNRALRSYELISAVGEVDELLGTAGERNRIVLVTRSLLGVFFFLCHAVEIPRDDLLRGIVTTTLGESGAPFDWSEVTDGLLRIQATRRRPSHVAVAVPYRGHWFYISDDDLTSKSTFALLSQLYALQSGDPVGGSSPVPTIPIGG